MAPTKTVYRRISELGWEPEIALSTQPGVGRGRVFTFKDKSYTSFKQLCAEYNVPYSTFKKRRARGLPMNECIKATPVAA